MVDFRCEVCFADIKAEEYLDKVVCPCCGSEQPVPGYKEYVARQSMCRIELTVKAGKSMWSMADGTTYEFAFCEEAHAMTEVLNHRIVAQKDDTTENVWLMPGEYIVHVRGYSWQDPGCTGSSEDSHLHIKINQHVKLRLEVERSGMIKKQQVLVWYD